MKFEIKTDPRENAPFNAIIRKEILNVFSLGDWERRNPAWDIPGRSSYILRWGKDEEVPVWGKDDPFWKDMIRAIESNNSGLASHTFLEAKRRMYSGDYMTHDALLNPLTLHKESLEKLIEKIHRDIKLATKLGFFSSSTYVDKLDNEIRTAVRNTFKEFEVTFRKTYAGHYIKVSWAH